MSGIEYYFSNLDFSLFQRLINSILITRFGEHARLTPLHGSDGGKDGETAPYNPYFEFQVTDVHVPRNGISLQPEKGRHLFQVKYHSTINTRLSDARRTVISDFENELDKNVLGRQAQERVNFFFLITNVPSSEKAITQVDKIARQLHEKHPYLYADIWWEERVKAYLDQMPWLWNSFPNLFAGGKVPFLAEVTQKSNNGLPRAMRMALDSQYHRDSSIRFRQIGLTGQEKNLSGLFTDLGINIQNLSVEEQQEVLTLIRNKKEYLPREQMDKDRTRFYYALHHSDLSALELLLDETGKIAQKIILEGGPGQGKSTLTQILTQIYRQQLLGKNDMEPEGRWEPPQKIRHPFRIELRKFAEWLSKKTGESIEEYLAVVIKHDSGGSAITVDDIHCMVEDSYVLLILDGLDEVGSDELRNEVLVKTAECIYRFENNLHADLRVIITTRPPTVANCKEYLTDFKRFSLAPMTSNRITEYVKRWLSVRIQDKEDRQEVQDSFEKRQHEPHVQALVTNPMQLSVLLHFIQIKGVAFPDHRAELYREYFSTVIDRDVEKSSGLREQREIIEALHRFLGYKIHALTEAEQADGSLTYTQLLRFVQSWLTSRGSVSKTAQELFKLGEERLGLIVALKGEGEETRYGFEVQPIREYFAAAFINDDIHGDAHEVFEVMVRRSYWKEVALFLAGLRRPNEKADLIARAKALDEDSELGWRQDGKSLILQLLQEGNFSQPPHLYSEALDFVFDILDPRVVRTQNEPKEFLRILPALAKQEVGKKRYVDRLKRLLQDYKASEDEYIIYRLYCIASQVLEVGRIRKELLSYQGASPDLVAKVRISWPSIWQISMDEAIQSPSFWEGISDHIWSQSLWYAIFRYNAIDILSSLPSRFHRHLLEQFAINSLPLGRVPPSLQSFVKSHPSWAIWTLINYQRLFAYYEFDLSTIHQAMKENNYTDFFANYVSQVNFVGLADEEHSAVECLIKSSDNLLRSIATMKNQSAMLENYLFTIRDHLNEPGLISWLAYKCAINFFRSMFIGRARPNTFAIYELNRDLLRSLWRNFRAFLPKSLFSSENTDEETELWTFTHSVLYGPVSVFRAFPNHIRLEKDGEPVDIVELIANYLCEGRELPFDWMKHLPLTSTDILRPLLERCRDHIPTLLTVIENTSFTSYPLNRSDTEGRNGIVRTPTSTYIASLSASDIQRILKVVRKTDDPKILTGGLIALSFSKFMRSAGEDLTLKMIRAASPKADTIINLFNRRFFDDLDKANREILDKIARSILKSPDEYAFQVICAAAGYLAEYPPSGFLPLLSMEDRLGLHISTKQNSSKN